MISFEKKPEVKNNSNSQKPADKKVATKAKEQAEKPSELSLADNDEKKPTVKG